MADKTEISEPTLVQLQDIGKVSEIVCGDSHTVVRSQDSDKVYGWGRGFSLDKTVDVSRFRPKELAKIETLHRFLVPPLSAGSQESSASQTQNGRKSYELAS